MACVCIYIYIYPLCKCKYIPILYTYTWYIVCVYIYIYIYSCVYVWHKVCICVCMCTYTFLLYLHASTDMNTKFHKIYQNPEGRDIAYTGSWSSWNVGWSKNALVILNMPPVSPGVSNIPLVRTDWKLLLTRDGFSKRPNAVFTWTYYDVSPLRLLFTGIRDRFLQW